MKVIFGDKIWDLAEIQWAGQYRGLKIYQNFTRERMGLIIDNEKHLEITTYGQKYVQVFHLDSLRSMARHEVVEIYPDDCFAVFEMKLPLYSPFTYKRIIVDVKPSKINFWIDKYFDHRLSSIKFKDRIIYAEYYLESEFQRERVGTEFNQIDNFLKIRSNVKEITFSINFTYYSDLGILAYKRNLTDVEILQRKKIDWNKFSDYFSGYVKREYLKSITPEEISNQKEKMSLSIKK
ncbi:MAG: hypothetical protein WA584_23425 [Pyrinomonadaceae bacterium]